MNFERKSPHWDWTGELNKLVHRQHFHPLYTEKTKRIKQQQERKCKIKEAKNQEYLILKNL